MSLLRGRGGQTPRRADQAYNPPAGVVLGPGSKQVFVGRLVVIFGSTGGLFVYNGAEAKGNLVAQIVPPGVTSDPVGDTVNAVLNIGTWSAAGVLLQHFGVDQNGIVYIVGTDGVTRIKINNGFGGVGPDIRFFNDFGAVILAVDPSRGGTFQYQDNNSAVQGVLIGAQVGKNTTDPVNGTAVNAGVSLIDPVFGDSMTAVGATINLIQAAFTANAIIVANTGSGATSPFLSLAGPEQGHAGHGVLRVYGVSADGTVPGGVIISTTDPPVRAAAALLEVQGSQALKGIAAPAAPPAGNALLFSDTSGRHRVIDGSDGNNYATERAIFASSAAAPGQLINSVAPVAVTGITGISVAAAAYHIRGMIIVKQGGVGPGNQAIQIAGPAITSMNIAFESVEGATIFNSGVITALNTNFPTGAIPLNTVGEFHFDGIIRFSASGATFGLAALCVTSGVDNWTLGTDSYLELSPL